MTSRYIRFFAFTLDISSCFYSLLGKLVSSTFDKKKNDTLYNIQYSYQALRYSIVYINQNCEAAIIFNNLRI